MHLQKLMMICIAVVYGSLQSPSVVVVESYVFQKVHIWPHVDLAKVSLKYQKFVSNFLCFIINKKTWIGMQKLIKPI